MGGRASLWGDASLRDSSTWLAQSPSVSRPEGRLFLFWSWASGSKVVLEALEPLGLEEGEDCRFTDDPDADANVDLVFSRDLPSGEPGLIPVSDLVLNIGLSLPFLPCQVVS